MSPIRAVAALALLALAACTPEAPKNTTPADKPAPDAGKAADGRPAVLDLSGSAKGMNVLFISMDAMRWDRVGASGNDAGLTPNLGKFAKEATVFTNVTSAASWTVPSHMAMFTGQWPSIHGVTNKLKPGTKQEDLVFQQLAPEKETFPQHLIQNGYVAAAFTGGAGVSAKFGYDRGGFDKYLDDKPFAGYDYTVPPALDWLTAHKDQKFFMFLHGYDVHGQHDLIGETPQQVAPDYKGPLTGTIEEQAKLREQGLAAIKNPGDPAHLEGLSPEDIKFLTEIYDAKVKEADARLGKFLDAFRASGLMDKTIIAIVADHGDEFMEHGYIDHGPTLCQHQLHVPMMIRFPGHLEHREIADLVRTIDVFPTLFDAVGVTGPVNVAGRSLLPLLRGEKLDLPIYAETDYRLFVHQRMQRIQTRKLILDLEDGQKSLFDLATDPDEQKDLSAGDARTTYEMEQSLRTWMLQAKQDPQDFLGVKQVPIKLF
jgi:arylsulfatase A-like enzyme